jgi:hypothetical protein
MKNQIAQLNRAYEKNLKVLNKNFFEDNKVGLDIFVEHLKYIRDCLIIKTPSTLAKYEPTKTKLATLVTAIAEFEAYKTCQNNTQRVFHWNNFCEFLRLNMEEWLKSNDSI